MIDTKHFSLAMSVYKNDNPNHFKLALDSIINQKVKPSEIVLVVDGPIPDNLNNVVKNYSDSHSFIKPIFLEKNGGLGNALRIAIEESSYQLIARMDSDDISVQGRFEKQLRCFEEDESISIVGGYILEFIDDEDDIVGSRIVPVEDWEIKEYLKKRCPFNHMTVMYKKDDVLRAGNYMDWFWNEDYYLWIRMFEHGCKFKNLPVTLVNVRVGADMYKRRGGRKYFKSEVNLQRYMLEKKIIGHGRYALNFWIRSIIQLFMPNFMRGFVIKNFARKKVRKLTVV